MVAIAREPVWEGRIAPSRMLVDHHGDRGVSATYQSPPHQRRRSSLHTDQCRETDDSHSGSMSIGPANQVGRRPTSLRQLTSDAANDVTRIEPITNTTSHSLTPLQRTPFVRGKHSRCLQRGLAQRRKLRASINDTAVSSSGVVWVRYDAGKILGRFNAATSAVSAPIMLTAERAARLVSCPACPMKTTVPRGKPCASAWDFRHRGRSRRHLQSPASPAPRAPSGNPCAENTTTAPGGGSGISSTT